MQLIFYIITYSTLFLFFCQVIITNPTESGTEDVWNIHASSSVPFGGTIHGSPIGHTTSALAGTNLLGKRRFSKEQHMQMKESLRSLNNPSNNAANGATPSATAQNAAEKESFRLAVQKTITYLFEKTESSNVDEFIDRFNQGARWPLYIVCLM